MPHLLLARRAPTNTHPLHRSRRFSGRKGRLTVPSALFAFLLAVSAGLMPADTWARDTAPATATTLETLNDEFRALYRERTQQVLEELPLVLVVQNHTITAVRGTQRRLYPVPLQRYNEARAIVHAVLGFHGLMGSLAQASKEAGATTDTGAGAYWARLQAFEQNLKRAHRAVGKTTLTREEQAQARRVLDLLHEASHHAFATKTVSSTWLAKTLRRTEAPLMALAESVGRAHAAATRAVLLQIQADATEQEWNHTIAVVTGPMTPRRNNVETAIVASVLGSEHLGTRIFYSENIFSVDGALAYLQTLVGDRELSENVFGQPYRMWEDLFAPVSRTLVEEDFYTALPK